MLADPIAKVTKASMERIASHTVLSTLRITMLTQTLVWAIRS